MNAALLQDFLWQPRARVLDKHNEDPLLNVTLFAHSQGGLVAKIFIHRVISNLHEWIKQLVTVGTPFYGTWAHQSRLFIGEPMLNFIYAAREMALLIAALPGPYNRMFMSNDIYRENQQALGLIRYPMRTPDDEDGADP